MINVSIVLYNSDLSEIDFLIKKLQTSSVLNNIYLVDNSPIKTKFFDFSDVNYFFTGNNIGYGSGHNLAIHESINSGIKYHLVLNSDISFNLTVLDVLLDKMERDDNIGMIMPKVLNEDGTVQVLPKLLPSPFNLFIRVISPLSRLFESTNKKYTLQQYSDLEINVPIISGCFSLFRVDALKHVGLYDEKFFMYFEDFDISRRVHSKYKTIYYPEVSIIHAHERGAAKNFKLFKVFLKSAIIYFNKYGWFFDSERRRLNMNVFNQLNKE